MVTLEGTIKRFVGLASDVKPQSTSANPLPPGSSFLESDTGVIARFNGTQWRVAEPDYAQHELLVALWLEVRQLRHVVQTATGIDLNEDEAVSV